MGSAGGVGDEQVVLLEFSDPCLKDDMVGVEMAWRSQHAASAEPFEVSSPRFHRFLTVKFRTFPEAESYVKALQGHIHDKQRRAVEVIHKGAKDRRPPQVIRRGAALSPAFRALRGALKKGETLEQVHFERSEPKHTRFFAVLEASGDAQGSARDLATVERHDDGKKVTITKAKSFGPGLHPDQKNALRNLAL